MLEDDVTITKDLPKNECWLPVIQNEARVIPDYPLWLKLQSLMKQKLFKLLEASNRKISLSDNSCKAYRLAALGP